MLVAVARRAVRILPQVRNIRNHPSAVTALPPLPSSKPTKSRRKKGWVEDDYVIVGENVEEKYEKYPRDRRRDPLTDPSLMTLVQEHRVEFPEDAEPKVGYTQDELAIFDRVAEIKIDDALRNFKESQFDAEFLDSVGPGLTPTYNVAALADKNEVIKQLVALKVEVYKWDKKPEVLRKVLNLKWEDDVKPKMEFLVQTCGIEVEALGKMLCRNPVVLAEEMQHLEARLEFLRDKRVGLGLKKEDIARVLSKEAYWLSTPVEAIENRLNFFRNQFALSDQDFKRLVVSRPQIISVPLRNIILKKFSMVEEMGFTQDEIRKAILNAPKILTLNSNALVERFQILHLDIGFSHSILAKHSTALYCRGSRLKERHLFLKYVGRDQYDNTLPGYISPEDLWKGTDQVFVEKVAKSTKEKFENFVKSL